MSLRQEPDFRARTYIKLAGAGAFESMAARDFGDEIGLQTMSSAFPFQPHKAYLSLRTGKRSMSATNCAIVNTFWYIGIPVLPFCSGAWYALVRTQSGAQVEAGRRGIHLRCLGISSCRDRRSEVLAGRLQPRALKRLHRALAQKLSEGPSRR